MHILPILYAQHRLTLVNTVELYIYTLYVCIFHFPREFAYSIIHLLWRPRPLHTLHFNIFQSAFVTCSPLAHLNHSFQRLPLNQLGNLAFTGVKTSHTTVKMSDTQQCVGVAIRSVPPNERTNERTLTVAPLRSRSSLRLRSLS